MSKEVIQHWQSMFNEPKLNKNDDDDSTISQGISMADHTYDRATLLKIDFALYMSDFADEFNDDEFGCKISNVSMS